MNLVCLTVRLETPQLDRVVAFYRDVLLLGIAYAEDRFAIAHQGNVELMFVANPDAKIPAARGLVLEMTGVDRLAKILRKKRVKFLWGPKTYPYGRREFSVADPDGNELIFSERVR